MLRYTISELFCIHIKHKVLLLQSNIKCTHLFFFFFSGQISPTHHAVVVLGQLRSFRRRWLF